MKTQIKHRYTRVVLFECDVPEQHGGMAMRYALEKAVGAKADLRYADLSFANLRFADLRYADLRYADLRSADLSFSDLAGANLADANLAGAKFSDDKLLIGERPFFTIGPIGSRCAMLQLWITDKGPYVKAGCFTGTLEEFAEAVEKTHGETDHGKEYRMAIPMMELHSELWTPT